MRGWLAEVGRGDGAGPAVVLGFGRGRGFLVAEMTLASLQTLPARDSLVAVTSQGKSALPPEISPSTKQLTTWSLQYERGVSLTLIAVPSCCTHSFWCIRCRRASGAATVSVP